MNQNNENFSLEKERIKLERLKVYGKILTVFISIGLGTFAVAFINYSYQKSQLQLQEKKSEAELKLQMEKAGADRRQAEMKYLGEFIIYALEDNIDIRIRFAEYFAKLTISKDLRQKWEDYHKGLVRLVEKRDNIEKKIKEAENTTEKNRIDELARDLAYLQQQLKPLRWKSQLQVGEGFILTNPNSNILSLENLENHRICGTSNGLQAFLSRYGVQNVIQRAISVEDSVAALERGVCDAIVGNNRELQRIVAMSERNLLLNFRIIFLP